ncbi:MAG: hypothetical protein AAF583_07055 [Pseudomonadota bacterium]
MRYMLTASRSLWTLGLLYLSLTIGFGIVIYLFDLHIIDEISDPERVLAVVSGFSPDQRHAHFWMTLVLDMPYPLAYGAFYIGLALRFFGRLGPLLALPALITIPADLIENTVQLFILGGHEQLVWIKQYATPVKLAGFIPASILALVALGIAIRRSFQASSDTDTDIREIRP